MQFFAQRENAYVSEIGQTRHCRIDLSSIPPPLQVLFGFHVPADYGTGGAWIVICEKSGLLLDVVFGFVAE